MSCNAIRRQSHAFSCNSRIIVHVTVKLHSVSPRAITLLLLVQAQLFSNCTQMCVITYTNIIGYVINNNTENTTKQNKIAITKNNTPIIIIIIIIATYSYSSYTKSLFYIAKTQMLNQYFHNIDVSTLIFPYPYPTWVMFHSLNQK